MKYASLIVTFNRKEKLINALNSVLDQTLKPSVIILIDNCSNDGTNQLLHDKGYLDNDLIHYVRLDQNYGGSGGFYYGVKEAIQLSDKFDYLSFSDDDAYFDREYFKTIENVLIRHSNILAYCGTVKNIDGTIQTLHRRRITNSKIIKEASVPESMYNKDFFVDTFSFVGSFVNINLIKQIGLPNKNYFIYFDDTEYSLRIRKHTKIMNVSNAIVIHDTKSVNNVSPITWKSYYDLRNSMLMKQEYSSWKGLRLYFAGHLVKVSCLALVSPDFTGIRRRALYTYWRAYKDALNGISGTNNQFLPGRHLPY